ncbi:MAG: transposase [Boseongicola sp. SB0662_bin_57]|nr:transposase [Boseongicola sp. SB0662_bin_57]
MALTRTHRQVVYRLLPQTRRNWQWLETTLEARRQLCNAALEERIDFHRKTGKSRTYFDQCKALTACRAELPDMAGCGIAVQRGTLKRLDEAFKGFFNRLKKGGKSGFPKFKGKAFFDSIAIVSGVKVRDGTLHIPGFGPMTIRRKGGNPHPDGRPVSAVLKRAGGKRTAVVCLAVESLDVKAMTRSAKGTMEEPGTNVPRKSGLNRVILNTGWTALKAMLECKAANVIAVPARNTSRTCHECGAAEAASRRTRDDFTCGHAAHADINAARNIRCAARGRVPEHEASGVGASARRGAFGLPTSSTREISARAA